MFLFINTVLLSNLKNAATIPKLAAANFRPRFLGLTPTLCYALAISEGGNAEIASLLSCIGHMNSSKPLNIARLFQE